MAMNKTLEANNIITNLGAIFPQMLTPQFRPQLQQYWEAVCLGEITHKIAAMDVLPAAHTGESLSNPMGQLLTVPAAGILDGDGHPCTGTAVTGTTSTDQTIVGMGSVQ